MKYSVSGGLREMRPVLYYNARNVECAIMWSDSTPAGSFILGAKIQYGVFKKRSDGLVVGTTNSSPKGVGPYLFSINASLAFHFK